MNKHQFPIFNNAKSDPMPKWFEVRDDASKDSTEILIYGEIGKSWWDDSGVSAKEFADELKAIPSTRNIVVGINSPGGSVWDGLAIYNLLEARRDKVTTRIDGVAASMGSVIAMAGKEVRIPRNAVIMIHDPTTFAQGDESMMAKALEALRAAKKTIAGVYQKKTGKTFDEISEKMTAQTFFTGDEAKDFGLADTVIDEVPMSASALKNVLSGFRNQPKAVGGKTEINPTSTAPGGEAIPENTMDKAKLIALLKKHGVTVDDKATIEQLEAQLESVLAGKKQEEPKQNQNPQQNAEIINLQNQFNALKEKHDAERKARIENAVQTAVDERRIPVAQKAKWVTRAMADETVLTDLSELPAQPMGDSPVIITSEAPNDLLAGLKNLRKPIGSMLNGGSVDKQLTEAIRNNAVQAYQLIDKNIAKLRGFIVQNAHSIDSDLKQHVIMTEGMRAFKRRIVPLNAFSTRFNNVALLGTDKVQVPYFPLFSTASTDFVQANGYVMAETGTVQAKEVTIDKRKYQPFQFNSSDLNRQPYFSISQLFSQRVEQLAVDVSQDVLSNITVANYASSAFAQPANAFDVEDLIDIKVACDNVFWPMVGRAALMKSEYEANLAKQLLKANEAGSDSALRAGVTGRIADFDVFGNPSIPANGENLKGFVCLPSALLVATSPIMPAPGVRRQLVRYDVVTDPDTGISFEYRYWGNPDKDEDREVVECNYGYNEGETAALMRITDQ